MKVKNLHFQGGVWNLHIACSTLIEFTDLPSLVQYDGKVYHKTGFNGTALAFYETEELKVVAIETCKDVVVNTGKQNPNGTFIYEPLKDALEKLD